MSTKLNILDLHRTLNEKKIKKDLCFDYILNLCHKKIIYQTDHGKTNCFYEVPLYVLGYPLFDISNCIEYLKHKLELEGFKIIYYFPKYLYMSWAINEVNKTKIHALQQRQYTGINDPLLNINSKNQNNILSYKQSGKLQLNLL